MRFLDFAVAGSTFYFGIDRDAVISVIALDPEIVRLQMRGDEVRS